MSDVASEEVKESSSPIENDKPSSSRRGESREETFALTGVDGVDEEVNDMHHYDTESVQEMVKHAVEEVEHHLEDEDAMLAERLSEAKKMASMARNENDINSASSSRRTSFSFDVPKFVEDNEDVICPSWSYNDATDEGEQAAVEGAGGERNSFHLTNAFPLLNS